jgi:hypothetical protein
MAHIIILDENGNEIGRSNEGHESGGGGLAEDHEATKVTLDVAKIIELHNINTNEGKKDE